MSSQSPPMHISSWQILSESGPVPSDCSARLDPEHMAFSSMGYDYPRRNDYHHGWEFSEPMNGYNVRQDVLGHPVDPLASSTYINGPRGKLDQLFPRIRTYEVIYTDDAMMKLGSGVHRQCFNCRATETTTWRRSMLSPGKLVCPIHRPSKFLCFCLKIFFFRSSVTSAGCLSARIRFRGQRRFHAVGGRDRLLCARV